MLKPQFPCWCHKLSSWLVSYVLLNVVAFVVWDFQLLIVFSRVATVLMVWRHPAGSQGHSGCLLVVAAYFCFKYFSFAVCMPQSVCICDPVLNLCRCMSTEHRPWASFDSSLPERHSPILTMLCCKTSGSARCWKEPLWTRLNSMTQAIQLMLQNSHVGVPYPAS